MDKQDNNAQTVAKVIIGTRQIYSIKQDFETGQIYRNMADDMSKINTNRGGGNVKGFYAEHMNTAEHNVDNLKHNVKARRKVIDDNGAADAATIYSNGQRGRDIQYKSGKSYNYNKIEELIKSGRYDGQVLEVNLDNNIFQEESAESLKKLKKLAKEHNTTIKKSKVTDKEADKFADLAKQEGNLRAKIGLDNKAPIVSHLDGLSKTMKSATPQVLNAAKGIAGYSAGVSIGSDILFLIETDATIQEAAMIVAKDAVTAAASSAATEIIAQYAVAGVSYLAANSTIVAGAVHSLSVVQSFASTILTFAGGPFGTIVATVSNAFVPTFLTGLITGVAMTTVNAIKHCKDMSKLRMSEANQYAALCKKCESIIREKTIDLKKQINEYYDDWNNTFDSAVRNIIQYGYDSDANAITSELNKILSKFNKSTAFSNFDEFDKAFSDENFVLTL